MADAIELARHAAIRRLARELKIDLAEARRWCDAWEGHAAQHGVAKGRYFWDSARGWIDAQRTFTKSPSLQPGDDPETTQVVRVAGYPEATVPDRDQLTQRSTSRG